MIEKITDQNLERYDSRLKEWCDRKFFEKGNYGKYQTTEESGAVAFYPAPNTPLEGKVKFSFKETPPASGDKSPDNPSTISGVSSVKVTRCGKNVLTGSISGTKTINDVTFTYDSEEKSITVSGTATAAAAYYITTASSHLLLKSGVQYCLSGCPADGSNSTYFLAEGGAQDKKDFGTGVTFTPSKDDYGIFRIGVRSGTTVSNLVFKPQLELGTTATVFEPYEGNDYTIQLGDTYYGGSLDVATGVMTVTWVGHVFDGTENFDNPQTLNYVYRFTTSSPVFPSGSVISIDIDHEQLSTHFIANGSNSENSQPHFYISSSTGNVVIFSTETSSTNLKTWLASQYSAGTPLVMVAKYVVPPIVQLSPVQILFLTQADKYTPRLNTVYTDADSVQISYLKSPIRDEYEKTQAILSLGGNS